jgi:hypothetical protein
LILVGYVLRGKSDEEVKNRRRSDL